MKNLDTQLCKAKSINSGQWVCGYYVKGLDMYGKEIHIIFEPTTVFYCLMLIFTGGFSYEKGSGVFCRWF